MPSKLGKHVEVDEVEVDKVDVDEDDVETTPELSDTHVLNERRLRFSRELEPRVASQQPNDSEVTPPQALLPPVNPLLNLKKYEEKKKQANIEVVLNKIRLERDELENTHTWTELEDKKNQLKELFVNAEKGIKENQASKSRFYEIIKANSKHMKELQQEIESTQETLEDYRNIERELKCYVDKYSVFGKFLESVAGIEETWRTVRDVLDSYETLYRTSEECARILEQELDEAVELRKRMTVMLEEKSSILKSLNNRLILLEVKRKDARDRRIYWEYIIHRIKNTVSVRTQDSTSLRLGINDLYSCMCRRLKVEPIVPPSNVQDQMDFIHKNIMFYKEVVTIASGLKDPVLTKDNIGDCKKKQTKENKRKQ